LLLPDHLDTIGVLTPILTCLKEVDSKEVEFFLKRIYFWQNAFEFRAAVLSGS